MKRRDFLQTGTAAGAAGLISLTGVSCGVLPNLKLVGEEEMILPDMNTYLAKVDNGLDHISQENLSEVSSKQNRTFIYESELGQKSLKTLYMTAMFSDLPEAGQIHPGMQERMWQAMPDMDEAIFGMTEYLSNRTESQKSDLQKKLQNQSNPGKQVADWLDNNAAIYGVSRKRRAQTRSIVTQLSWRLKNQSPGLVINEYIGKVQKLVERDASVEKVQRRMISRIGQRAFWEKQKRLAALAKNWEVQDELKDTRSRLESYMRSPNGYKSVSTGAQVMGIGAIVGIIGYLVAVAAIDVGSGMFWVGAISATVGAIMLLVGLIWLIIEAI